MIEAAQMIPAMTVSNAILLTTSTLQERWSHGLLNCDLEQIEGAGRAVARALYSAGVDDDLDLAEEPMDVIADALRTSKPADTPDDLAVLVYEALIDAGCLPGVNARHFISSSD